MLNLRKFVVYVLAVVFMVPAVFAQMGSVTKDASGGYSYETTISSLVDSRVNEEIKLINNSSYSLTHVTCTITINGKVHEMRPMPVLKLSDSEGFDGFFEDEMYREFPKYFGKDGRFSRKNNNVVKFTFNFRDHNDMVEITDVYYGEEDLCFVVSDASVQNMTPAPAPVTAPVKQQTVAKPIPASADSSDSVVVIDGKNYLIHDGKAYLIQ